MSESKLSVEATDAPVCAQCERPIMSGDLVQAGAKRFCSSCYGEIRMALERAVRASSTDVNYPLAAIGAVLGGAAGALVWWGFTVVTHIAFGLVAVVIGYLAGHGAVRFAGNKRTVALQVLATVVAAVSFVVASYLVNMTFVNAQLAKEGQSFRLAFPPASLDQAYRVVTLGFGLMDVVFFVIAVSQAWSIPRPLRIPSATT